MNDENVSPATSSEAMPGDEIAPSSYRKLPVVIQAIRWCGTNLRQVIDFTGLHPSAENWTWEEYEEVVRTKGFKLFTFEGPHEVSIGDYVIRGVKGEFYACKPDIFWRTYERAESPVSETAATDSEKVSSLKGQLAAEREHGKRLQGLLDDARRANESLRSNSSVLNALRGLSKAVKQLAEHFDKPVTDENVVLWLALNSAQEHAENVLSTAAETAATDRNAIIEELRETLLEHARGHGPSDTIQKALNLTCALKTPAQQVPAMVTSGAVAEADSRKVESATSAVASPDDAGASAPSCSPGIWEHYEPEGKTPREQAFVIAKAYLDEIRKGTQFYGITQLEKLCTEFVSACAELGAARSASVEPVDQVALHTLLQDEGEAYEGPAAPAEETPTPRKYDESPQGRVSNVAYQIRQAINAGSKMSGYMRGRMREWEQELTSVERELEAARSATGANLNDINPHALVTWLRKWWKNGPFWRASERLKYSVDVAHLLRGVADMIDRPERASTDRTGADHG